MMADSAIPVARHMRYGACAAAVAAAIVGCGPAPTAESTLLLATTTSVEDSGLLAELVPSFEAAHPELSVRWIAVGTGEALEIGRRGDADVVLVHSPAAESAFVAAGHGVERRPVMRNEFVLLGPPADPAGIRGQHDAGAALAAIVRSGSDFVSRGDDSGTHLKELALWAAAGMSPPPRGPRGERRRGWYVDAGQGMAPVLLIASERGAYTLSDRATYLVTRNRLRLEVMVESDPDLDNPYGVIEVTGTANPGAARAFVDWLTGSEGQRLIAEYGLAHFGASLFEPVAGH